MLLWKPIIKLKCMRPLATINLITCHKCSGGETLKSLVIMKYAATLSEMICTYSCGFVSPLMFCIAGLYPSDLKLHFRVLSQCRLQRNDRNQAWTEQSQDSGWKNKGIIQVQQNSYNPSQMIPRSEISDFQRLSFEVSPLKNDRNKS